MVDVFVAEIERISVGSFLPGQKVGKSRTECLPSNGGSYHELVAEKGARVAAPLLFE